MAGVRTTFFQFWQWKMVELIKVAMVNGDEVPATRDTPGLKVSAAVAVPTHPWLGLQRVLHVQEPPSVSVVHALVPRGSCLLLYALFVDRVMHGVQPAYALVTHHEVNKCPNRYGVNTLVADPTGLTTIRHTPVVGNSVAELGLAMGVYHPQDLADLQYGEALTPRAHAADWYVPALCSSAWSDRGLPVHAAPLFVPGRRAGGCHR